MYYLIGFKDQKSESGVGRALCPREESGRSIFQLLESGVPSLLAHLPGGQGLVGSSHTVLLTHSSSVGRSPVS